MMQYRSFSNFQSSNQMYNPYHSVMNQPHFPFQQSEQRIFNQTPFQQPQQSMMNQTQQNPFQQPDQAMMNQTPLHQQQNMMNQSPFQQFAKPKQPADWFNEMFQNQANQQQANANPNMNPNGNPNPNPGIISQFQDENGQISLDKMLNTVGQMANTYHQVQPIVKQFGSLINMFR